MCVWLFVCFSCVAYTKQYAVVYTTITSSPRSPSHPRHIVQPFRTRASSQSRFGNVPNTRRVRAYRAFAVLFVACSASCLYVWSINNNSGTRNNMDSERAVWFVCVLSSKSTQIQCVDMCEYHDMCTHDAHAPSVLLTSSFTSESLRCSLFELTSSVQWW